MSSIASDKDRVPLNGRAVPTLARRYGFKLGATVAAVLTGIGVDAFASRALGPADYGQFYFLQQFFFQILGVVGGSISLAFITRIARRPQSRGFVFVYLGWLIAIPLLFELFIVVAMMGGFADYIWPRSPLLYIQLGVLAAYTLFLAREGTSMGDAYGLTVELETIRTLQRIVVFLLILGIFLGRFLNILTFFAYTAFANGSLAVVLFMVLRWRGRLRLPAEPFRGIYIRAAGRYLYDYSAPLFTYLAVGIVANLFDRWLLQTVSGNVDQGYYSLAYQISQLMLFFVTAFVPLLMREMSIASGERDKNKLTSLYSNTLRNLYFVAAFGACFVAVYADQISVLVGGSLFAASALPVALVVLCTVHRTYGQISATLFYATGQTRLFRNISLTVAAISIAATWLLIGPHNWCALQLGAQGLAIKVFVVEALNANLCAYYACRFLGSRFRKLLFHQLVSAGVLLTIAAAIRLIFSLLFSPSAMPGGMVTVLLLAACIYTVAVSTTVWLFPLIAGLDKPRLLQFVSRVQRLHS
ncbi:MAG: oligosaccharide flippase family protein [Alphaproteobacteria bacterium]|nr:oligosaccharide flippase family protein [Alphaproteobacteria bacterium]